LNYLRTAQKIQNPHLAQYILLYLDGQARDALSKVPLNELRVSYLGYDKSLNEQP
jgi:hypothetical protein